MNERQLQDRIISEIRNMGGYGKKWASQWQTGVPDLILVSPRYGTLFIEVKQIKLTGASVPRFLKIKTTEKQKLEMQRLEAAGGRVAVLVGVQTDEIGRLYCAHHSSDKLDCTMHHSEWRRSKIELDLKGMLDAYFRK